MGTLRELSTAIRGTFTEWIQLAGIDLQLAQVSTAMLVAVILIAAAILMLLSRGVQVRKAGRTHVALPAILPVIRRSSLAGARHLAFALFVVGIPLFGVALADPRISAVREEVTRPGRRVAILVDGSGSMVLPFESPTLHPEFNRTFYTAVGAAERFLESRMKAGRNDLVALVQFGSEAYVVTPFTTDRESVLLSLKLIGQPAAWNRFSMFGTTIIQGLAEALELFTTFDLLDTQGNLIVIFTDGDDTETMFRGRTLAEIMADAKAHQVPIHMVRIGFQKEFGEMEADPLWKSAVEQSGGRFYVGSDEPAILRAVNEIDRLSAGQIVVRQYSSMRPAFAGFTLAAVALWLVAGVLTLGFPSFRTFP